MSLTKFAFPETTLGPMVKRGPGRPAVLDGRVIAEAVLAEGFDELTFALVAERLGVAKATLYRYAANRDELVRMGLDLALRRTEWPHLGGPWRDLLARWAMASWQVWARHPGAALEVTRGVFPTHLVHLSEGLRTALVERHFSGTNAGIAVDLVLPLAADSRRMVEVLPGALRPANPDEWFARKLQTVLAGVEQELAPVPVC